MHKPAAVLISDIHYNIQTIELADAAMRQAIDKANELRVPLIVAGDLHDTKANLRGECVKAMLEIFKLCHSPPYILVGNHCRIHEKSEAHSLEFLRPFAAIIDYLPNAALHKIGYLIPYQHDIEVIRAFIKHLPKGSQLIMHQGLQGSNSGEYFQDKSALSYEDISGYRVISGHYHTRQTIYLPDNGKWDYIGNPFSLNYGEANDPPKGFQILNNDGSLEFVPTNLRKHVVIEIDAKLNVLNDVYLPRLNDLVWVKVIDTRENLQLITKEKIKEWLTLDSFKLDLIIVDSELKVPKKELSNADLLDSIIDLTNNSTERKARLKELWRHLGS